jgi:DNA repair protein RadC
MTKLYTQIPGTRRFRVASQSEVATYVAGSHLADLVARKALLSPTEAVDFLTARLRPLEHEVFCCLFLDNRHRVLAFAELFRGTIDGASVHPREVVKEALAHNAAAVILAHNHPSGAVTPSHADELITRRLREALALLDIRVLDHVIIGGEGYCSFAERGIL